MNAPPQELAYDRVGWQAAQAHHAPAQIEEVHRRPGQKRPSLLHRFGWLPLYPLVFLFTAIIKIKNRRLATDDNYMRHQVEFFSFSWACWVSYWTNRSTSRST